ncbi:MMPL family transporter, partial [Actinoplanes sp. NPDC024001]|uniref:MMPL family transporter n=1 Tax=Actinoplanes sp. NPDC024001 TaxID=3154598 RepID=UPI0033DF7C3A
MKYVLVALWLAVLAAVTPLALSLGDVQNNDTLGSLSDSAEVSRAEARAAQAFPSSDAPVAVAVYVRDTGLTGADRAQVEADRQAYREHAEGGVVAEAFPSADGKAVLVSFTVDGSLDDVRETLSDGAGGMRTALTGSAAAETDVFDAFEGLDVTLLIATGVAVSVLLLITYRSPVLWLLPLLTAGIASQLASAIVYLLAKHGGLAVDLQSQNILTVLVFGVGIDYALLIVARYREELRRHADRHRAMGVALRRSLGALVASAATVIAGLLCLLAADMPETRGIGPIGAVGIACALLAMTTLLPAVLLIFGRWVFWPFVPRYTPGAAAHDTTGDHRVWGRVAAFVGRRPRQIWIASLALLALLGTGVANLGLGQPAEESFTTEVGSVTGQKMISAHYPSGVVAPVEIVAAAGAAEPVAAAARAIPGIEEVTAPQTSPDGRWVRIDAVLADVPDSDAAMSAVRELRSAVHAVPGADALVGGDTAYQIDLEDTVNRDNRIVIPLILAVVLAILILLLRALVAPLLLMASVVLSFGAALGVAGFILTAIGYPNLMITLPLQVFLFLVALGVDYTIFLMTRAREEAGRIGHRPGVLRALTVTGGVITSAGLVLAATFAALSLLPLVPSLQMAVIVAAGVLIDTFLVRSLLVPALALELGERTWWPARLPQRP